MIENWRTKKSLGVLTGILTDEELQIMKGNKKIWDEKFNLNLFEFRHRIQEIHLDNVHDAGMVCIDEFSELIDTIEHDDIVIPSDDDDFFHPQIRDYLKKFNGLMVWKSSSLNFNSLRYSKIDPKAQRHILSCGYAIKGNWLRKIHEVKGSEYVFNILHWHWFLRDHKLKETYVPYFLSLYNYHCGSVSQLRSEEFKLPTCSTRFPRDTPEIIWAKPYITRLYQVYEESGLFKHKLI